MSLSSIARFSAGIVAIAWALLGLADALAAGMGRGADLAIIVAVAANAALIVAALLAFARTRHWRAAIIASTAVVTADRIAQVIGTGDWWLAASSIAMLVAVVGISSVARSV